MLPFSYEDRFPDTQARHGYAATNEEPLLIKEMVAPFRKGMGICSAGEVTFLALLPRCRESLVLIDHSYNSLKFFCLKALLLATLGPKETRKLLIDESQKELRAATDKLLHHLPVSLTDPKVYGSICDESVNLRREWHYADLASLRRATNNLHKIKLIHGDLTDTDDRAPYDLIYLSNALEHSGRLLSGDKTSKFPHGTHPDVPTLTRKLLKKGSRILWVQAQGMNSGSNTAARTIWKIKTSLKGYRTSWQYHLAWHDGHEVPLTVPLVVPTQPPLTQPKMPSFGSLYVSTSTT